MVTVEIKFFNNKTGGKFTLTYDNPSIAISVLRKIYWNPHRTIIPYDILVIGGGFEGADINEIYYWFNRIRG